MEGEQREKLRTPWRDKVGGTMEKRNHDVISGQMDEDSDICRELSCLSILSYLAVSIRECADKFREKEKKSTFTK